MTNYDKIKQLIETGFMVKAYDNDDKDYCIFYTIMSNGKIKGSKWRDDYIECLDAIGELDYYEEEINILDLTLTPIPHIYKEIKGKVDILDTPELRELFKEWSWSKNDIKIIDKKGLEIERFVKSSIGEYYEIYIDNSRLFSISLPAWAVVPHFEDEDNEIEKIDLMKIRGRYCDGDGINSVSIGDDTVNSIRLVANKLNEIIDKLNK